MIGDVTAVLLCCRAILRKRWCAGDSQGYRELERDAEEAGWRADCGILIVVVVVVSNS